MATQYHVYANDLAGGPVDYDTPIATVATLTYSPAALPLSSDATFAIRAFDTVSGLKEANVDARVRIVTDEAGVDVTNRPLAPSAVTVSQAKAGAITVEWTYPATNAGGKPIGFRVYLGTPTVSYAVPAMTTPFIEDYPFYRVSIPGLIDGSIYEVTVRAYNATAESLSSELAAVIADATGPDPVESLTATATA